MSSKLVQNTGSVKAVETIQAKYNPTKLSQVIGSVKAIETIKNWLETYEEVKESLKNNGLLKKSSKGRKKKLVNISPLDLEYSKRKGNLLITGSHGCGKSLIVNLILKSGDYDVINLNNFDSKVDINSELISKLAISDTPGKKVLVIDEYESIITLNDKVSIFNIIKENNYNRWMPVIIVTNNQHNKHLNETKKYSNEIKIYAPFPSDIGKWVYNICKSEKIMLEYQLIQLFIEYCQNDLRKILIQLDELKINYGTDKINQETLEKFMDIMKKKDKNYDLYKATEKMLLEYESIDTCLELYESQKVLMPLMIHENYHDYIKQEHYYKIIDIMSKADLLENYIHGEQNWDLLEIHGYKSCAIPSYYINKYRNNNSTNKICFAIDLNRTSVKKMNKKNINKTNDKNGKMDDKNGKLDCINGKLDGINSKLDGMNGKLDCINGKIDDKNNKTNIRNKSIEEFIYMNDIIEK
jgi:hypothetical protein